MKKTILIMAILLVLSVLSLNVFGSYSEGKTGSVQLEGGELKVGLWMVIGRTKKSMKMSHRGSFRIILKDGYLIGNKSHIKYKGKKYYFEGDPGSKGFMSGYVSLDIRKELTKESPPFTFNISYILKDKLGKVKTIHRKIMVKDAKGGSKRFGKLILTELKN
ncbi:MAG: hypothetical protein OEZ36_05275 [Spirochaetota bacterium]|nr:hypothetical protein [Spirochaetota bacterium]